MKAVGDAAWGILVGAYLGARWMYLEKYENVLFLLGGSLVIVLIVIGYNWGRYFHKKALRGDR